MTATSEGDVAVRLLDFRMCTTGSAVVYSLQLSNGKECWVVARRYSEFLRCHVKLLELFDRKQLPPFPPKEPFWQKVFGGDDARSDWMEERYGKLFGYLVGLLDMEGVLHSEALLDFLNAPRARRSRHRELDATTSAAIAIICSVRVRLTGDPGGVEVVIRADAPARCSVRLALRPFQADEQLEDVPHPTQPSLESTDQPWERLLELDLDPSKSQELTHRFDLDPGSLWQVAAVGVAQDGTTGNPVCIQIRAPTEADLESVPKATFAHGPPTGEAEETGGVDIAVFSDGGAEKLSDNEDSISPGEEELDEVDEHTADGQTLSMRRRKRSLISPAHKVISFQGSVALEYARKIEEKQRLAAEKTPHRWEERDGQRRSVPVDRLETKSASGAAERLHYGTVEVLDHSIQAHQEQQLREDELRVAAWIHAVTGDPGAGRASVGSGSLQDALQSGEVLCDLINAIWPGRIVGIARGSATRMLFRRVANITQFVQACTKEGMANSVFVPGDLAEGKNFRSVLRCLCALAHQVPDSYEGPRLATQSTGAILGELERTGDRLRYCLLKGTGPPEGWISFKVAGKDLVQPASALLGPSLEEPWPENVQPLVPESKPFPAPKGRCFGKDGKMKMLYLHGGGVSKTVAQMQLNSTFKEFPGKKQLEWTIWTGPHAVPLGWNGDFSLKPFGPNFTVYFERLPFANCQWETWEGFEKTLAEFKKFLKENGPFDGAMGFDMGGEFLVHVAGLATEGDPDLKEAFRFLMLFTTTAPKHLSPMGKARIKAPLQIPTICSWSNSDENHPYMEYEELPLFIHRDFREVIVHHDGHKPPLLKKEQTVFWRFARFLDAMEKGWTFTPTDHEDNALRAKLWLPMLRSGPCPPKTGKRRLLVVPDPVGMGDLPKTMEALQAMQARGEPLESKGEPFVSGGTPPKPLQRLELLAKVCQASPEIFQKAAAASDLEVQHVSISEEQSKIKWHCDMTDVPSRQLLSKDIINDEQRNSDVQDLARKFLEATKEVGDAPLALVGLGTGAFIAFAIARELVAAGTQPLGLWLVDPSVQFMCLLIAIRPMAHHGDTRLLSLFALMMLAAPFDILAEETREFFKTAALAVPPPPSLLKAQGSPHIQELGREHAEGRQEGNHDEEETKNSASESLLAFLLEELQSLALASGHGAQKTHDGAHPARLLARYAGLLPQQGSASKRCVPAAVLDPILRHLGVVLQDSAHSLSFTDLAVALETLADAGIRPRSVLEALMSAAEACEFPTVEDGAATSVAALLHGWRASGRPLTPTLRERLKAFLSEHEARGFSLSSLGSRPFRVAARMLAATDAGFVRDEGRSLYSLLRLLGEVAEHGHHHDDLFTLLVALQQVEAGDVTLSELLTRAKVILQVMICRSTPLRMQPARLVEVLEMLASSGEWSAELLAAVAEEVVSNSQALGPAGIASALHALSRQKELVCMTVEEGRCK
ncbi:TAGLN2 [Symbiodinium natans]|uniref:TAGLN2 protein n=1 Tax=Symbiodinium natans TaxID=878477 RepID=A0A812RTB9_9DINO|nr:TAGLN2 [Symbiodinium natans]